MENHRALYKEGFRASRQYNKENRKLLEAKRAQHRSERFQDGRNLSLSPVRIHKEIIIPLPAENKENIYDGASQERNPNCTRFAKIICNGTKPEKLTKQEAYIKRFIEWKENKRKEKNTKDLNKKKPFINTVRADTQTTTFVPTGHHNDFRPPTGLKSPIKNEKVAESKKFTKKRQSIYTVVPTPPRRQPHENQTNKFPIAKKAIPNNIHTTNASKPTTLAKLNDKTVEKKKSVVKKSPASTSSAKVVASNLVKSLEKRKTNMTETCSKPPSKSSLKPRVLKLPPPPSSTKVAPTNANVQKGAISTVGSVTQKRTVIVKQQRKKSPLKCDKARLAQNLKAKKTNTLKKGKILDININGKKLLNLLNESQSDDMLIDTPRDIATFNHFDRFVTSTQIKNPSLSLENEAFNSTLGRCHKKPQTAKRNLMQDATKTTLECNTSRKAEMPTKENYGLKIAKRFNFLRYSNVADETTITSNNKENDELQYGGEGKTTLDNEEKTPVNSSATEEAPRKKHGPEERPVNYLSPCVSVTRGKVSLRKEKEKRNSMYLQNTEDLPTKTTTQETSPKNALQIRRTLEAVRYFRKQLQDEIDRLHKLCDVWEKYKEENLEKIQNANGEDMINVTIGQTRLLTSKKFMQFKGLIDRCESCTTGIGLVPYDGSENTKPITSDDLEGFWSMLGLQVDNLDKRFANLNRWKCNDWNDPEEVKPLPKKNLTKVKKAKDASIAKDKRSSGIQQLLRKMHEELRKNKNKNNDINGDVLLIPPKIKAKSSENNNTNVRQSVGNRSSRCLSIVVKDRKYFSPAATVISVSSPSLKTTNMPKSSQDSPKILKHIKEFNEAADNLESSINLRKSALLHENSRHLSLNAQPSLDIGLENDDHKALVSITNYKDETPHLTIRQCL